MNLKSKEFKDLKDRWYKKLKKSGFVDIEEDEKRLLEYHNTKYSSSDPLAFSSQQRYFELAGQLLHSFPFKSSEQRTIWTLHCEGKTVRSIGKRVDRSTFYVRSVIDDLAKLIKVD